MMMLCLNFKVADESVVVTCSLLWNNLVPQTKFNDGDDNDYA